MNKVVCTFNVESKKWSFNSSDFTSGVCDIDFVFTGTGSIARFEDLRFGYEFKYNSNIISYDVFPKRSIKYKRNDGKELATAKVNTEFDKSYDVIVWVEHDSSERIKDKYSFHVPIPKSPYKSWKWNGDTWVSPIPKPLDGNSYNWDESSKSWKTVFE